MTAAVDARPRTLSWGALVAVFAVVAALYAVTFTFRGITDTELNSLQTRALVLHGDVDLARYKIDVSRFQGPGGNLVVERDGHIYSVYGVGVSLVAAPFYAPLVRLGVSEHALHAAVSVSFAAAAVVALLVALLRVVPKRFAVLGALVFAFGTSLWSVASMAFFQQAPVLFFTCVALIGIFSDRPRGWALAGGGMGMAALIRPTMAIPLCVLGLYHLGLGRRRVGSYIAGASGPIVALLVQNRWIWGSWLKGGYSPRNLAFDGPFGEGFGGELIGWWRGLLIYSPFLALALVGWIIALRSAGAARERVLSFLGVSALGTILLYAKWPDWGGGLNQFGYRLLLEIVPFLIVLATFATWRLRFLIPVAISTAVLSVATMTVGAAPSPDRWDSVLFAREFSQAPIGRAWRNFFDHPGPGVGRLALVAATVAIIALIARRVPERVETA